MEYDFKKFFRIVIPAVWDTFYMITITMIVATFLGFVLAISLYLTQKNGIKPNKFIYKIVSIVVNTIRSVPFLILAITVIPLTRFLLGTAIGRNAALVPLIISGTSFVTRIIESALREVDEETIMAIKSFGASDIQLLKEVVLVEAIPSLISGLTVFAVSILGSSASVGAVGGGGLGAVAISYGYYSYDDIIMYGTIAVLVIIVQIIQTIGNKIYNKSKR